MKWKNLKLEHENYTTSKITLSVMCIIKLSFINKKVLQNRLLNFINLFFWCCERRQHKTIALLSQIDITWSDLCARAKKSTRELSVWISHTIYPIFNRVRAGKLFGMQCSRHRSRWERGGPTHVNVIRLEDSFSDLPGRCGGWIISALSAVPTSATLLTVWKMGFCGSVCGR